VFGSEGEHTKVAGICTKPGQFSQLCRGAGGRPASACHLLSGRCKKTFEFASKHLKRGKNLAEIAHRKHTYIAGHNIIVRRNMASLRDGVKNRAGNFAIINATLSRPMSEMGLVSRVTPVHTALRNCTRDEGGPFEFGNQVLISSHRKLLWSKAPVVNVAEKLGHNPFRHG
jgi:hypothetical protein